MRANGVVRSSEREIHKMAILRQKGGQPDRRLD